MHLQFLSDNVIILLNEIAVYSGVRSSKLDVSYNGSLNKLLSRPPGFCVHARQRLLARCEISDHLLPLAQVSKRLHLWW